LIDNYPIGANSLEKFYFINGKTLSKHYKEDLSGYHEWDQKPHAEEWILFPENIGTHLCLDEVALSDGELYIVLTNAKSKTQKGCLIAMTKGIKSENVNKVLAQIPLIKRKQVKEVSVDMANNMEIIVRNSFPDALVVTDRFHVAQLISEAVQEMRIKFRWEAIDLENKAILDSKQNSEKYTPFIFPNGDTRKQLLARSRYLLFKSSSKLTKSQQIRADIFFREYPQLQDAYNFSMMFRNIYETSKNIDTANQRLNEWCLKVKETKYNCFITAAQSVITHKESILNFFVSRSTNALAENFNSKIKAFRAVFRGITDLSFFLYRVYLIFA
jgi:transposase